MSDLLPLARPTYTNPLRRIEWVLDDSPVSQSAKGARIRYVVGGLFALYGLLLLAINTSHGRLTFAPFVFPLLALPIFFNRLGRLGRYFIPVVLGFFAYGTAASYVNTYKLGVHYQLQINFDRWIGNGTIPTEWLQQHLYSGHAGYLESACVILYAGHFTVPLALGLALALLNRSEHFKFLMFAILTVSVLAAFTYLLAPTAPPWLAAQNGHLNGVHEILKQALRHMHLGTLARLEGDASKYDITAAAPSLHTAYPFICLVAAIRARLPRVAIAALALNLLGVVFAIVYMGEHYVFDVVAGALYATVALTLMKLAFGAARSGAKVDVPAVAV